MKLLKKACRFLCVGLVGFAVTGVKASTGTDGEVLISDINFDGSGNTSVNISYNVVNDYYYGDLNNDSKVDLSDAQIALKISVG